MELIAPRAASNAPRIPTTLTSSIAPAEAPEADLPATPRAIVTAVRPSKRIERAVADSMLGSISIAANTPRIDAAIIPRTAAMPIRGETLSLDVFPVLLIISMEAESDAMRRLRAAAFSRVPSKGSNPIAIKIPPRSPTAVVITIKEPMDF